MGLSQSGSQWLSGSQASGIISHAWVFAFPTSLPFLACPVLNWCAGMPGIGVWQPGGAAAERAAARAARGGRERRARPVRVRMVQINLRAILQLAVMGIILYQVSHHLEAYCFPYAPHISVHAAPFSGAACFYSLSSSRILHLQIPVF